MFGIILTAGLLGATIVKKIELDAIDEMKRNNALNKGEKYYQTSYGTYMSTKNNHLCERKMINHHYVMYDVIDKKVICDFGLDHETENIIECEEMTKRNKERAIKDNSFYYLHWIANKGKSTSEYRRLKDELAIDVDVDWKIEGDKTTRIIVVRDVKYRFLTDETTKYNMPKIIKLNDENYIYKYRCCRNEEQIKELKEFVIKYNIPITKELLEEDL